MPSARGVWLEVASGQMLRHTPGATMNSSGSAGMTTFHIRNRPVSGHRDQQARRRRARRPGCSARIPRQAAQAQLRRDLRVVGERDRGHQPVHPAMSSPALWRRAARIAAEVEQDGAAEVRAARGEREERLVAEAQDLGVAGRGDRHRARAAVEEGDLAERAGRQRRRRSGPPGGRRRAGRARGRSRPGSARPARRGSSRVSVWSSSSAQSSSPRSSRKPGGASAGSLRRRGTGRSRWCPVTARSG